MHWGHLSSPDLVTWKEEPVALAPSPGFDNFGVWSGTTILDDNGEVALFYTGVDGSKAGIGLATPLDSTLTQWEKERNNPLIPNPPPNFFSLDFRDPYVFKKDDLFYMIVGSGLSNDGGGILFTYTSPDLKSWTLVPPLFQSADFVQHGTFWEMPAMFEIEPGTYALVVTPQFPGAPADVIYWTGSFDGNTFQPYQENAKTLELLSEKLLAPAFGQDEDGRWTYIGIIPDDRDVALQIEAGWRHTFSLPRVTRLLEDNQTLATIPHPNLCRLRLDTMEVSDLTINANTPDNLSGFSGNQSELNFDLNFSTADYLEIQVLKNGNGTEKTSIILDRGNNRIGLDRRQSSPYPTVEDLKFQDYIFNATGDVEVRIFLDHSVLEVFVDQLVAFSARVYPREGSQGVDITTPSGQFLLNSFRGHQLGNKADFFTAIVCAEDTLPDQLYTGTNDLLEDYQISIYPNPASKSLYLELDQSIQGPVLVSLYSFDGKLMQSASSSIEQAPIPIHLPQNLTPGNYLITIITQDGKMGVKKFVKN